MSDFPYGFKNTPHSCTLDSEIKTRPIEFECHYSGFGWLLFSIGMSAKPARVDFVCRNCKEVIESTTDSAILKKYVGR